MAIAPGVSSKSSGTGTSRTTTGVATQASGSAFYVAFIWDTGTFSSISDNKGNTYTQISTEQNNGGGGKSRRYYRENGAGGAGHTVTVNFAGSSPATVLFLEITGGLTSGILDQSGAGTDSATPFTLGAGLTTTQADELLVTFFGGTSGANPATHTENGLGSSTIHTEETNGVSFYTAGLATSVKSSTGTFNPSWTEASPGAAPAFVTLDTFKAGAGGGGGPATLSAATPSGTLATSATATLGATSDQTAGTFYGVVDTAGNISGITATQIKAGQNKNSVAAVAASNSAVSTTTPSTAVSGLTANTAYSYAVVQNNANGDSNVLTGTFTTAVMPPLLLSRRIYFVDQSVIQI